MRIQVFESGRLYGQLGIWILIYIHPGYTICDLFYIKEKNIFWNFTFIGVIMANNHFDQIGERICIRKMKTTPNTMVDYSVCKSSSSDPTET